MKTINLKKEELKSVLELSNLAGRLDELERNSHDIATSALRARRKVLERQIREILSSNKKEEDQVITIKLTTSEVEENKGITFEEVLRRIAPSKKKRSDQALVDILEESDFFSGLFGENPTVKQFFVKG